MKHFLRFQIVGSTVILWLLLLYAPYVKYSVLGLGAVKEFVPFLACVILLAMPVGVITHQISISLFSPFRRLRPFSVRNALSDLKTLDASLGFASKDYKKHYLLSLARSTRMSTCMQEVRYDLDTLELSNEISARYSYYYVRIDNGVFAPLVAFVAFKVSKEILLKAKVDLLVSEPFIGWWVIPSLAMIVACILGGYCVALMREVDDLERYLLKIVTPMIQKLNEGLPQEKSTEFTAVCDEQS